MLRKAIELSKSELKEAQALKELEEKVYDQEEKKEEKK